MKLSIPEAALAAVSGYAVVFLGLILLMAVVIITGKVMTAKKTAAAPAAAAPAAAAAPSHSPAPAPAPVKPQVKPAPGTGGEVCLYNVSDRDAALLMAIVADKMGKPLNELRFKSMKEVK